MKIGIKITFGFLVVVVIFTIFGYSIYLNEKSIETITSHFSDELIIELNTLQELKSSSLTVLSSTMEIILIMDEKIHVEQQQQQQQQIENDIKIEKRERLLGKTNFENAYDILYDLSYGDQFELDNINNIKENWDVFLGTTEELIEAKESGIRGIEILELKEKLKETEINLLKSIDDSLEHEFDEVIEAGGIIDSSFSANFQLILWGIVFVVIASIIIGLNISNSISKPIVNLKRVVSNIAAGNFDQKIDITSNDEIGELAHQFDVMKNAIKNKNEQLSKSEKRYKDLYENSPDLYRTINTDGTILDCNQSYVEALGYTKKEIIGKSIFKHVSDLDYLAMQKSFNEWKKTGRIINRNVIFKRKDNSTFPVIVTASSLYDVNGVVIGSNTIIRDMSQLRDAEKKIEYEQMKRLSVIGELTSHVSHDLLNPLTAIQSSLTALQTKPGELDERTKNEYQRLERSVSRMTHQIENVLDFVKKKPLRLKNCYLSEILKLVKERIRIPPKVILSISNTDTSIYCDPEKMEILFINLITNSIQAMNNVGKIDIRITDEEKYVLIEIKDSGCGISEENVSKIFDPLFTTKEIGTGLGLFSCKNIVENHKGAIEVKSVNGKGTTFRIKLPKMVKELVHK